MEELIPNKNSKNPTEITNDKDTETTATKPNLYFDLTT